MNQSNIPRAIDVTVFASNDADKKTSGQIVTESLTAKETMLNAFKLLGKIWGLTALCIFIPVFHFVLVPTGLIVGVFMFSKKMNVHEKYLSSNLICPQCHKDLKLKTTTFNWPLQDQCSHCETDLFIEKNT